MAFAVIHYLDRYGVLCLVIVYTAQAALCLLHRVGVGACRRVRDLAKALRLVRVCLRDRNFGRFRHRRAFRCAQRECETVGIRPLPAIQHLLDLDLALAFRFIILFINECCRFIRVNRNKAYSVRVT